MYWLWKESPRNVRNFFQEFNEMSGQYEMYVPKPPPIMNQMPVPMQQQQNIVDTAVGMAGAVMGGMFGGAKPQQQQQQPMYQQQQQPMYQQQPPPQQGGYAPQPGYQQQQQQRY